MSKWKSEFRRLHLKRNGESLEMISNGPLCSTMFATGRQNLKHVCVELEVNKNVLFKISQEDNFKR